MKLLIVAQVMDKNHPILGFFHRWVEEFAKSFTEVHVICLQKGDCELPPNVYTYSLGKEAGENNFKYIFRYYKYFTHIFFTIKVDYVFFHMGSIFTVLVAPFYLIRKLFKTKFYWWKAHGHLSFEGKVALLFVDKVVTSTESGFPVTSKKKHVIGQAIDTSLFVQASNLRKSKEVLFAGRIMPVKQLEVFLDVAEKLHSKGYTFTIAGPVGDEAYFAKIKSLPGAAYVTFAGPMPQPELVKLYQQADIFLNTSVTHSMDKTVLEAILCGCLPVTSNKAFKEMLEKHGLYHTHQNVEKYVQAICALTTNDTSMIREELRNEVCRHHSIDTFTKRIFPGLYLDKGIDSSNARR